MLEVELLSDGLVVRCVGSQGHETQRLTEAGIDAMAPAYGRQNQHLPVRPRVTSAVRAVDRRNSQNCPHLDYNRIQDSLAKRIQESVPFDNFGAFLINVSPSIWLLSIFAQR